MGGFRTRVASPDYDDVKIWHVEWVTLLAKARLLIL